MTQMQCTRVALIALAAMAGVVPTPSAGQAVWLDDDRSSGFSLEVLKPFIPDGEYSLLSTATFLGARIALTDQVMLIAELPFAHASADFGGTESVSADALGNPYLGLRFTNPQSTLTGELGARAPLVNESADADLATSLGFVSDLDRFEAFLPEVLAISGTLGTRRISADGIGIGLRVGGVYLTDIGDTGAGEESDFWLTYGTRISYEPGAARLAGALTGRWLATANGDASFADASFHHVAASADYLVGGVRPGVQMRLPLDDDVSDFLVDGVIGVYLQVPLR